MRYIPHLMNDVSIHVKENGLNGQMIYGMWNEDLLLLLLYPKRNMFE